MSTFQTAISTFKDAKRDLTENDPTSAHSLFAGLEALATAIERDLTELRAQIADLRKQR